MNEFAILEKIEENYVRILKDKLVGIYVHGSIAFGCFNWDKSDIDFIVVINDKLTQEEKEALIYTLHILEEYCPKKGLEMSVVLENVCNPFIYPTPYELHFSNAYREISRNDLSAYCKNMNGTDKDLAAHFTVINAVGITLCGKERRVVFAPVPKEHYLDSIFYDIEDADKGIEENPVYFILNLCRVLAYLKEGSILSKKQGGDWGKEHLPARYTVLLQNALASYQTDADFIKDRLADDFAKDMLMQIKNLLPSII